MKDFDTDDALEVQRLRDEAFLAALEARERGFTATARALDAIIEELMARASGARRG